MRNSRAGVQLEDKIKTKKSLLKKLKVLRLKGKKVVFTNGCFDLLHYGHVKYLDEAKKKADILVVAINSDSSVKRIKGNKRPLVSQKYRAAMLAALACVDYVVVFEEDTPLSIIKYLRPDVLVKGADWKENRIVGSEFVESYGGKVSTVRLVKGLSTTKLIKEIVKNY